VDLILADDSVIIREGLTRLLTDGGHHVCATVSRPEPLLAAVAEHDPDAVVLDIRMPPTHTDEGLRSAAALRARYPRLGILLLSQYVVPEYATRLLGGGDSYTGYLLKDRVMEPAQLTSALARIAAGGTVVDAELVALLLRARRDDTPLGTLTERESDVLRLMAEGMSDKGIATSLFVSTNTVGTHIRHIFSKLGLADGVADNRRVLAVLEYLQRTRPVS
jgi:DNA-binding NarL/FixJ family response regulator